MCEITVSNLHSEKFNKMFFLLAGSLGSLEHSDGWGYAVNGQKGFKCKLPMHYTTNAGKCLWKDSDAGSDDILIGHIRRASPQVPVTTANAHPFVIHEVSMVHNGKLTPKEEKDFVMEEDVVEVDAKDETKTTTKKVKRSDSLIFFEKFMEIFEESTNEVLEERFVDCLKKTMDLFYGKFAMVFLINGTYFVVRGRTADLHISYLLDDESEKLGWVINTSKKTLDNATVLMSNTFQLLDGIDLNFTLAAPLETETIYICEERDLRKIGELKENSAPVTTYASNYRAPAGTGGATNFTGAKTQSGTVTTTKKTVVEKYAEEVWKFMDDYSLSVMDVNYLFLIGYDCSLLEVNEAILEHFVKSVIPRLRNKTNKTIRKLLSKAVLSYVSLRYYNRDISYPWMLNEKTEQMKLLKVIQADVEKAKK